MPVDTEHRLTEVEARSKSNAHRLDKVEERQDNLEELVVTVKTLAVREQQVENDVKEIKSDVKTLTNKPAKRWEDMVSKIIAAIVAGLVGFAIAHFGF